MLRSGKKGEMLLVIVLEVGKERGGGHRYRTGFKVDREGDI